jgi:hypothetical protein
MPILAAAFAALLLASSPASAQTGGMHPDQFATEGDAKVHCSNQTIVWMNTRSHVYHYAGTRDYGHTKSGAYMCQSDADKAGRAAKKEKPPAR